MQRRSVRARKGTTRGSKLRCATISTTRKRERDGKTKGKMREMERRGGEEGRRMCEVALRAGCASFRCACTAARPTRRPLLAARWCRSGFRTLWKGRQVQLGDLSKFRSRRTSPPVLAHRSIPDTNEREEERERTSHFEPRSNLRQLHLLVTCLDEDVVTERDEVAFVDEGEGSLGVVSVAARVANGKWRWSYSGGGR